MQNRILGKSVVGVSELRLGTMSFGALGACGEHAGKGHNDPRYPMRVLA